MRLSRAVLPAAICALISAPVAFGHPAGLDAGSTAVPFLQPDGQLGNQGPFTRAFRDRAKARAAATASIKPVRRNVRVVGKAQVTNPAGTGNQGRIADVSAHGDYAYLTAFREPTCQQAGAHVFDISNPKKPFEIKEAFMETTPQNYAGEGSHTLRMKNRFFKGVLFMHQNETCPGAPAPTEPNTRGGINIWDITEGDDPQLLVKHAGDNIGGFDSQPNQTHSQFAWTNKETNRTYVVLVDDEELTDIDILDITDPRNPQLINDTLDLDEPPFDVDQPSPGNLTASFSHDMVVKRVGKRYVMSMSYWDGGYVQLDVTDPTPGNVSLIAESDFAALDEERLARGQRISPEGNAHQSELSPDNKFLVATDEDFNPYRLVATITSGPYQGTEYTAVPASSAAPIDNGTRITDTPTYVGNACNPLPVGDGGVALVERGGLAPDGTACSFQLKLDNVKAAGYSAGIVFNNVRPDCLAFVNMLAAGTIPFIHVNRVTGLQLLGVEGVTPSNACTTPSPAAGAAVSSTTIESLFEGWGFIRLFGTNIPKRVGQAGSIRQIDTFSRPESQDPAYAAGNGDLSVHEVALDPKKRIAYVSYYGLGFRVLEYGSRGLKEVGAFVDKGGSNFWGVEIHRINGRQYVLGSDRDFGLYIFDPQVGGRGHR
jgi:PA domain-containing protein